MNYTNPVLFFKIKFTQHNKGNCMNDPLISTQRFDKQPDLLDKNVCNDDKECQKRLIEAVGDCD